MTEETLVKKISTLVNRIDDHVTLTPDFHSVIKAAEFSPKDLLMQDNMNLDLQEPLSQNYTENNSFTSIEEPSLQRVINFSPNQIRQKTIIRHRAIQPVSTGDFSPVVKRTINIGAKTAFKRN